MELIERGDYNNEQTEPLTPSGRRKIDVEEVKDVFKKGNLRRGFSIFDENKDGRIDVRELKRMISHMGNSVEPIIAQRVLNISDTNNDGYLDYHEFEKMLQNPQLSELFGLYVNAYVKTIIPKRQKSEEDEIDGSFEAQYSCWPPPLMMVFISVIEIIFFIIDCTKYDSINANGPMAKALMYDPHRRYEAWRFLTYMCVHVGYMHLCVNLIVQILLGVPLEMVHKGWRIMIIYLAGVTAGSLATSIFDPNVYLAGASGGVYSLITAHIASVVMNWAEMTFPLVQLGVFLILTVCDFGTAYYNRYYLQIKDHIGYEAHLAGAIAGLIVGIFVLRNLEKNKCEKKLWWISICLYCSFIIFAVVWHITKPDHFPSQIY